MKEKSKAVSDIGYQIFRPFLRGFSFFTMHPKVIHKERIPKKEGFIFAGTHTSHYDFMTVGGTTMRAVHFLTKKELTDIKGFRWYFKLVGLIRVDRSKNNPEAVKAAIDTLKKNRIVCVFPEGTINKTNDYIMPFKPGAIKFAIESGKKIVPFAIVGKSKPFNYGKVKILIGNAYNVESKDIEKEIKILEEKVIELIKEGRNEKRTA